MYDFINALIHLALVPAALGLLVYLIMKTQDYD